MSYPKYLMEIYLERYLEENKTIDHIDGNPLNNELSNLRVLNRQEHCSNDCARNRRDRHQSGYFCSRKC